MKWSTILSASALVAGVLSGPIQGAKYALRVSAPGVESLNNKHLSISDGIVGLNGAADPDAGVEVVINRAADGNSDNFSLHIAPAGIADQVLGLTGGPDLVDFKVLTNPEGQMTTQSTDDVFSYEAFSRGSNNELRWGSDKAPGWVAKPAPRSGNYVVVFDNGPAVGGGIVTQDYIRVKVFLEQL